MFAPKEGVRLPSTSEAEDVQLEQIEELNLEKRQPLDFYFWLDRYFLREHRREPRTEKFLEDFGTRSHAFRYAASLWLAAAENGGDPSIVEG